MQSLQEEDMQHMHSQDEMQQTQTDVHQALEELQASQEEMYRSQEDMQQSQEDTQDRMAANHAEVLSTLADMEPRLQVRAYNNDRALQELPRLILNNGKAPNAFTKTRDQLNRLSKAALLKLLQL